MDVDRKGILGKEYAPLLDEEARGGLDRLKKRFGPSNPLATIRNNYAFHHPTKEQMEAAFQLAASNKDSEDVDWSVFFNRALLNTFFFVSDYVLVHGIADILKESDVNVAHEKLLRDLAPIANDLSEFTFGFAKAIFQKYIGREELVLTVVAKIADAPDIWSLFFLALGVELLPFVESIGNDQTALTAFPCIPERWFGRELLRSGVERRIGELFVLRPMRQKSPAHHLRRALTIDRADRNEHRLGRR